MIVFFLFVCFSYELLLHNYLELQIASSSYAVKILRKVVPIVTTNQTRYGIKFVRSRYKSSQVIILLDFLVPIYEIPIHDYRCIFMEFHLMCISWDRALICGKTSSEIFTSRCNLTVLRNRMIKSQVDYCGYHQFGLSFIGVYNLVLVKLYVPKYVPKLR